MWKDLKESKAALVHHVFGSQRRRGKARIRLCSISETQMGLGRLPSHVPLGVGPRMKVAQSPLLRACSRTRNVGCLGTVISSGRDDSACLQDRRTPSSESLMILGRHTRPLVHQSTHSVFIAAHLLHLSWMFLEHRADSLVGPLLEPWVKEVWMITIEHMK
jgi:hypothetical protein